MNMIDYLAIWLTVQEAAISLHSYFMQDLTGTHVMSCPLFLESNLYHSQWETPIYLWVKHLPRHVSWGTVWKSHYVISPQPITMWLNVRQLVVIIIRICTEILFKINCFLKFFSTQQILIRFELFRFQISEFRTRGSWTWTTGCLKVTVLPPLKEL